MKDLWILACLGSTPYIVVLSPYFGPLSSFNSHTSVCQISSKLGFCVNRLFLPHLVPSLTPFLSIVRNFPFTLFVYRF